MREDSFRDLVADKLFQDNPLVLHLRPFAASLSEDGYQNPAGEPLLRS